MCAVDFICRFSQQTAIAIHRSMVYHQSMSGNAYVKTRLSAVFQQEVLIVGSRIDSIYAFSVHINLILTAIQRLDIRPSKHARPDIGIEMGWSRAITVPVSRTHNVPHTGSHILASRVIIRVIIVHASKHMSQFMAYYADMRHGLTIITSQLG